MIKQINRSFVLLMCIWLICLLFTPLISVQAISYKIPKPEKFNPSEAADDIEYVVNENSIIDSDAIDGKIYIDGAAAAEKHAEAVNEMKYYEKKLNNKGLQLNRELTNMVTVRINGVDFSDFIEINIDLENINHIISLNTLKIALENKNEYIALNKESISSLAANKKDFKLQIRKLFDTYTIRFLDKDGTIINKYSVDIKIALPGDHSEQTVYLFMNNSQENWGGQYNPLEHTVEFMTRYSGEYNVASPEIIIGDIDDLTEYEKQAVRFMVVRGYFGLEDSKFNPNSGLTRYDFSESLVRMFFAIDNEATCTFTDVDKKHYRYVSASQQSNIVEGFDDQTFKGNEKVTVEQVLALASRTINKKNGYVYPEKTDKYLNFAYDNEMSNWAKKEIALAIREGIYSKNMNLGFVDEISRKDACVILYRLFMIMNNTPKPVDDNKYIIGEYVKRETVWNEKNAIIIGLTVVTINIIAFTLSTLLIKRKRKG